MYYRAALYWRSSWYIPQRQTVYPAICVSQHKQQVLVLEPRTKVGCCVTARVVARDLELEAGPLQGPHRELQTGRFSLDHPRTLGLLLRQRVQELGDVGNTSLADTPQGVL